MQSVMLLDTQKAPANTNGNPSESSSNGTGQPVKYKLDPNLRKHAIKEVVSSEDSYVAVLSELHRIYYEPFARETSRSSGFVTRAQFKRIFSNFEALYQFHTQTFLPALHDAISVLDLQGDLHSL